MGGVEREFFTDKGVFLSMERVRGPASKWTRAFVRCLTGSAIWRARQCHKAAQINRLAAVKTIAVAVVFDAQAGGYQLLELLRRPFELSVVEHVTRLLVCHVLEVHHLVWLSFCNVIGHLACCAQDRAQLGLTLCEALQEVWGHADVV
jgi:hypothetical protein